MYRLNPLFLLLFIGMTSCTTYQYVRLDSDLPQKADGEQYYYDSEDIFIAYDFNGDAMPIFLYMENTGNRDIYLDLSRSMFLENDQIVQNLMIEEETATIGVSPNFGSWVDYGTQWRNEEVVLIPPRKILKLKYYPFLVQFEESKEYIATKKTIKVPGSNTKLSYKQVKYETPRDFEIRLVFANNRDFEDEWVITTHFEPDLILFTQSPPEEFFGGRSANVYHTQVSRGQGWGDVLLTGFISVLVYGLAAGAN